MKSVKLNKSLREKILNNIIKVWRHENPKPNLSTVSFKLGEKAVKEAIGEKKYLDLKAIVHHNEALKANFDSSRTGLNVVSSTYGVRYISWKPEDVDDFLLFPATRGAFSVKENWKEYKEWIKKKESFEEWERKQVEVISQVKTVLDSVSTTKQLLEAWPEVAEYVEPFIKAGKVNLPALPIERINSVLGWA
jgi:hypothetical protein